MKLHVLVLPLLLVPALATASHGNGSFCSTDAPAVGIVEIAASADTILYLLDRGAAHSFTDDRDPGEGFYVYQESNGNYQAGASPANNLQTGGVDIMGSFTPDGAGDWCISDPWSAPDTLLFAWPGDSFA